MKLKIPDMVKAAILNLAGYDLVEEIEEEDDEEENEDMIGSRITNKTLKQVEDDWIDSYIIN